MSREGEGRRGGGEGRRGEGVGHISLENFGGRWRLVGLAIIQRV